MKPALPYIIAEMACAHEGSTDLVIKLIDIAVETKTDAIQLQIFSVDKLISPHHPGYKKGLELEICPDDWCKIIDYAIKTGIDVWVNIFDNNSLEIACKNKIKGIKIHSSDLGNDRLLKLAAKKNLPINLSIGGSSLDEIAHAVWLLKDNNVKNLVLMHGYQGYPTTPNNACLQLIPSYNNIFDCPIGYQDHTDGSSELAIILPLIAMSLGACVLEKHYTLDREQKGTDYEASLNPNDFKRFVELVRSVNCALGDGSVKPFSDQEKIYRKTMKKSIVASQFIPEGDMLSEDCLCFLRTGEGLSPSKEKMLIGKKTKRNIKEFDPINYTDLDFESV